MRCAAVLLLLVLAALLGCARPSVGMDASAEAGPPDASARWRCPAGWVPMELGGCGPAVLLCATDGGAARGACDGVDLARPPSFALPDGGAGTGFGRAPDGRILGGWPAPAWSPELGALADTSWSPRVGPTSCPSGWSPDDGGCAPALRTDCPAGSEALPGGTCTPTAPSECPSADFADVSAESGAARVVYARAGADPSGADGTQAAPFPTLAAAATAAGAGGWVLLAAGSYPEALASSAALHVVGVCASRVTLEPPASTAVGVALSRGANVELRGLTVRGAATSVQVNAGASLTLRRSRVELGTARGVQVVGAGASAVLADSVLASSGSRGAAPHGGLVVGAGASASVLRSAVTLSAVNGVLVDGAGAGAEVLDSVVRRSSAAGTANGYGASASTGATLRLTRVLLEDNAAVGAGAFGVGSALEASDCVVQRTASTSAAPQAYGVAVGGGARATLAGCTLQQSAGFGVGADGSGTTASVSDSVVRDTRFSSDGANGRGLQVQRGARLTASHVELRGNGEAGAAVFSAGSRLELTDCVARDGRSRADGYFGMGFMAELGGTLTATRVLFDNNGEAGGLLTDAGTSVTLRDVVVRGTRLLPDGTFGRGLELRAGAHLDADGLLLEQNHGIALHVLDRGSQATVRRAVARDTRAVSYGYGLGLVAAAGGSLTASQTLVQRSLGSAVVALNGGVLTLEDSALRDTAPRTGSLEGGRGAEAEQGASLTLRRVGLDGATEFGVFADGAGTSVSLEECSVRDVTQSHSGALGRGVQAQRGAQLLASRVAIQGATEAGVCVSDPGTVGLLSDVLLLDLTASLRGLGGGILSVTGASVTGARVAVEGCEGVGLAVGRDPLQSAAEPARAQLEDVFLRRVSAGTVEPMLQGAQPRQVAFALESAALCSLELQRAVLLDADVGVVSQGGNLSVREGVIARMRDTVGLRSSATSAQQPALTGVLTVGNASDAVREDAQLPQVSFESVGTSCPMPPCM